MTTKQVVETSVTVNNNSPIQDYVHPDDQTQPLIFTLEKIFEGKSLGLNFICGNLFLRIAEKKCNKSQKLEAAKVSCHMVYARKLFTSHLV